nr:hypothetical protein [Oscillospiraceae bacterium]
MKRFIRAVCIFMVFVTMFTTVAFAAESRASNFFMATSTYIDRYSNSKLEIWFDVTALGQMEVVGVQLIKLQRSTDKSDWETVKTYKMADYSQMTCSNTSAHADCVTYYGSSTYYYRAYVEFYAKNSSGTGVYSKYTATV